MTESWKTALNILLSKTSHLEFYPQFWFSNVEENEFVSFFTEQFEKEILFKGISDNYFLSQLLLGSYLYHQSEGVPRYLTAEGFESAKQNINKLVVVNNSLQAFLSDEDNVDAFFMSNVFDWGKSIDRQSICKAVLSAKAKQSLVLYRNMYAETELPEEFSSKFEADDALSQELLAMERSMLYRRVTAGMLS
jgi:S-adenosylmethionine:diacylglycerol 3-amino-3-carboxypropyl transferase